MGDLCTYYLQQRSTTSYVHDQSGCSLFELKHVQYDRAVVTCRDPYTYLYMTAMTILYRFLGHPSHTGVYRGCR